MDDFNKKLLATYKIEFLQESREIIEQVSTEILLLEADPHNDELLDSIFRGIHTIKGGAGVYEMQEISDFTHSLEEVLNALRDHRIEVSADIVDAVLNGIDHINFMFVEHNSKNRATINVELVEKFKSFLNPEACAATKKQSVTKQEKEALNASEISTTRKLDNSIAALPAPFNTAFEKAFKDGLNIFRIRLLYTSEMLENGYDPLILIKNIKDESTEYYIKTPTDVIPALNEFEPLNLYLKPTIYIATSLAENEVRDLTFDPELMELKNLSGQPIETTGAHVALDKESVKEFVEGAYEWLEIAEHQVIHYEENNSLKALNEIFRVVHNIKGDAAYLGLVDLKSFSHSFETLLDRLRSGQINKTSDVIDITLKSIDFIKQCVHSLAQGRPLPALPPVFNALQEYQHKALYTSKPVIKESFLRDVNPEYRDVFANQLIQYKNIIDINSKQAPILPEKRINIIRALHNLLKASRVVGHKMLIQKTEHLLEIFQTPDQDAGGDAISTIVKEFVNFIKEQEDLPNRLGEILVADGKLSDDDLLDVLSRQRPIGEMLVEAGKVSEDDVYTALEKQKEIEFQNQQRELDKGDNEIRTMRVDEQKIEQFTNMIGEMLIVRNTYSFLIDKFKDVSGENREAVKSLKDNFHLLSRLTNDLQHSVISLRMIPIRGIFQKFNRVVRDISRKQKKMIELVTEGNDVEIDKKVADVLSDPMVHLVRNSCDHGLETPWERKNVGKKEKGTITLKASREGANLCIRIVDDGRGINREKLFEKVKKQGFEVESIDDPDLLNYIFLPGISTKAQVSELSGRGVGMDVVKTTVRSLGGTVSVTSEENKGTEIVLSLPTTMGIETALFVELQGKPYAIPIDYVVETVKLPKSEMKHAGRQMMFHHRGEVLISHYLGALLDSSDSEIAAEWDVYNCQQSELSIVIIKSRRGKFGLIVDSLSRNQEIAIKPVPRELAHIEIISGVSILGDGKVLLVLNPEKL
ncbi:Hpt domain-containing protein [candidate division KSB1 bacterium]|nr:Hpt domain-containing protein [candidate division KSB1 bacterium]